MTPWYEPPPLAVDGRRLHRVAASRSSTRRERLPIRSRALAVTRSALISLAFALGLLLAGIARAHGDPVSERLELSNLSLPSNPKADADAVRRLATVVREAGSAGFRVKVAVITRASDLGPRWALYGRPQQLAQFVSTDLGSVYDGRILVVMPGGFGYAVNGEPRPRLQRELAGLPHPGRDPTKEAKIAAVAVRRLALADDVQLPMPRSRSTRSEARDRLTIAAAATAAIALFAGLVLYRRGRTAQLNA